MSVLVSLEKMYKPLINFMKEIRESLYIHVSLSMTSKYSNNEEKKYSKQLREMDRIQLIVCIFI